MFNPKAGLLKHGVLYPFYKLFYVVTLSVCAPNGSVRIIVFSLLWKRRYVSHVGLDLALSKAHVSTGVFRRETTRIGQRSRNKRTVVAR